LGGGLGDGKAVARADEGQQQLSRLAPSVWELSGDISLCKLPFGRRPGETQILYFNFAVAMQAQRPQSLCLCASGTKNR